jgi:hypothetical protein
MSALGQKRMTSISIAHDAEPPFKGDGVDFLQMIYKNPNFDVDFRLEAATRAASFERPKKSETAITQEQTYIVRMPHPVADLDEWKRLYGGPTALPAPDDDWQKRLDNIKNNAKDSKDVQ